VVLAAGKGSRMRSKTPKPLQRLGGRPLISYPLAALQEQAPDRVVIVRNSTSALPEALGDSYLYVEQTVADGTGGALLALMAALDEAVQRLLVVNGDSPFISSQSLRRLTHAHSETGAAMTLLAARGAPSSGLGKVVLEGPSGRVARIVEAKEPEYAACGELFNVGAYCFDAVWLRRTLPRLPRHASGEYYLTDLVELAVAGGRGVEAIVTDDAWEALGINTRVDLAQAEDLLRQRVLESLMLAGVTILDPSTTYIDSSVEIGQDTVIRPNTYIHGHTVIGEGCDIGPGSQLFDSQIGDNCRVWSSVLESASLEDDVTIGPFSHLRPGAYLSQGVHVGNFGEVKASRLGRNVAMGHFSYIGDAEIGDDVNIGAGTITCNFDGVNKNRTIVEEGAFIGSDTMLVAPIRVGARAKTGAGSVVTKNVPPDTLVAGVPARAIPGGKGKLAGPEKDE
jgi:bifunctional UDP-N-acetylglucosamine pyrophosphorylase/glucosamine-1-phosphate N-acetyltransferase